MITNISYSESDIVALREMAELQYNAVSEKVLDETSSTNMVSYNFDTVFMENCIYAGYSMDEAVDAALQKWKLLTSEEMKLVKRLAKETQTAVKKKDYITALSLAKKRLAHLENMVKRADNIDDDESFIIAAESMAKSYIITIITTQVLVAVANGILPGSGPIVSAIKKGINAFKLYGTKKEAKNLIGKGIGKLITTIANKFLTIHGASKVVSTAVSSKKQFDWKKNRNGDVNREVNEGRPDTTHMSISRTQAKTKLNKLIQAQKEEIYVLEANAKGQKKSENTDNSENDRTVNESTEMLDEFTMPIVKIIRKYKAYKEKKAKDAADKARQAELNRKFKSMEDEAYQYFHSTFIGPKVWIEKARKTCKIPKDIPENNYSDALIASINKAIQLPEFKQMLQSYNKAVSKIEAHDKARYGSFAEKLTVTTADFKAEDCGDYIEIIKANQSVNVLLIDCFEQLAKALISDAGHDIYVDSGDGDEGCIYINESNISLDEGFFKSRKQNPIIKSYKPKPIKRNPEYDTTEEFQKWFESLAESEKVRFVKDAQSSIAKAIQRKYKAGFGVPYTEDDDELWYMSRGILNVEALDCSIYDFYDNAKIDYRNPDETEDYERAMKDAEQIAKSLGYTIGYGGDWDDGPYYILDVSDTIKRKYKQATNESAILQETKLKATERNELPDSAFGIPSKRKFPLNDPAHVKAAIKMFRHASPADRPQLAKRIKSAIKKFNLDIEIGEENPLHEYIG